MKPITLLAALLVALLLPACSQEQPEQKPQPPAEQSQPATPVTEKVEQKVRETVAVVEQKAAEVKQVVEEKATAVKQQVEEKTVAAKDEAVKLTEQAKESTSAAVKSVENVLPPALGGTAPATPAIPSVPAVPNMPTKVSYQASMGTVTFDHTMHSGKFSCDRCHTTDPPQKIAISKTVAHDQLCKVCHKESGAPAPTACNGCHKK